MISLWLQRDFALFAADRFVVVCIAEGEEEEDEDGEEEDFDEEDDDEEDEEEVEGEEDDDEVSGEDEVNQQTKALSQCSGELFLF